MAVSRYFGCDTCDTGEAVLTWAQEWGADSPESAPGDYPGYGKVAGLFSVLWCDTCQAPHPLILLRLSPPADHAVVAFAEAQRRGLTGSETGACSTCGNPLCGMAENKPCPSCHIGTLRFLGEWETNG